MLPMMLLEMFSVMLSVLLVSTKLVLGIVLSIAESSVDVLAYWGMLLRRKAERRNQEARNSPNFDDAQASKVSQSLTSSERRGMQLVN